MVSACSRMAALLPLLLAALVAAAGAPAAARVCGRSTSNTLRDALVGYEWAVGLGEPLLPLEAPQKTNTELKARGTTAYSSHLWQSVHESLDRHARDKLGLGVWARGDARKAQPNTRPPLAPVSQDGSMLETNAGKVLRMEAFDENALSEADDSSLELAEGATHTTVVAKRALLVVECNEGDDKKRVHDAYVRVPTLHNEVGFRKHGSTQYVYVPVVKGRVSVRVVVNLSNGKRTMSVETPSGSVRLRTQWKKHPTTGVTMPALYGKVVKIPGRVVRGRLAPCLDARGVCALVQKVFHDRPKALHQKMMCAAKHESGWVPSVYQHEANVDGSMDAGLMQINSVHWARILKAPAGVSCARRLWKSEPRCMALRDRMLDPEVNMRAARDIYLKQGIGAWYGFSNHCTNDRYLKPRYNCPVTAYPADTAAASWLRR